MATTSIVTLTQTNFENDVIKELRPVLVDFWAEWCGPCKMISPIIDELASDFDGKVKFGKVNVDEAQELAAQYGIRAVPTILIFHGGEVVDQLVGLRSKRDLKISLEKYLDF
jgi:thioredoxin 1